MIICGEAGGGFEGEGGMMAAVTRRVQNGTYKRGTKRRIQGSGWVAGFRPFVRSTNLAWFVQVPIGWFRCTVFPYVLSHV